MAVGLLVVCAGPGWGLRVPEEGGGPRVVVYTMWSRQYLCLGVRVPDTMLTGSSVAPMSAPEQDDGVEFCVEVPTARGPAAYRLAISAAGGMTVLARDGAGNWRTDSSWISGPKTVKFAVVTEGTLNQPSDVDTGFVVECAIPWEFLTGGEAPVGERLRFNAVCWMQGESQGVAGWSAAVDSEEEVGEAGRWGWLVVSYGSGPSAGMGGVAECPYAGMTPFVDGRLAAEEWLTASTLVFHKPEAGVQPVAPTGGRRETVATLAAIYRYDWTGDMMSGGGTKLWTGEYGPATPEQPKEACGPWYSYERVAWHRGQLEEMTKAGVDVILARYEGDQVARGTWARVGLDRLTEALKERRAAGNSYPLVGMYLDTGALKGAELGSEEGKRLVYGMVRDFFLHVPPEFRAQLGGGVPVLLGEPEGVAGWDSTFPGYCDGEFEKEFGQQIAWLGSGEWQKKGEMPFYGFVRLAGRVGLTQEGLGGAMAMSIAPGYCVPGRDGEIRSRREGRSYRTDWQRILAARPELVVINSWNDFANGTEIAPSREYGYSYVEMTQLFKARLGSDQPHCLRLQQAAVPKVLKPGASYVVEMLIENTGTEEVRTGRQVTADYRIVRGSDNTVVQEQIAAQALLLPAGFTRRMPVEITTKDSDGKPLPPGEYVFSLAVMKSKVSYLRSPWFAKPLAELRVPITVGEPPARRATVISTSLPSAMQSGATENVIVRVRNDGSERWRVGEVKLSYHWVREMSDPTGVTVQREVVNWEGARADLPREVAPGGLVSVMIPVSAANGEGAPLPPEDPRRSAAWEWGYRLQWDVVAGEDGWFSREGGAVAEEAIGVVERDWGVTFKGSTTPAEMAAGEMAEVEVTVGNGGASAWPAGGPTSSSDLVYTWYPWDGKAAGVAEGRLPMAKEVSPGESVTLKAAVTAPEAAGRYWLAWRMDLYGGHPAGGAEGCHDDLLVVPVVVKGGKYRTLELSSFVNVAAITTDSYRTRGDFDGQGRSLPAECLPPDLSGGRENLYPQGYYSPCTEAPISFAFPDSSGGVGGAVACNGQTIPLGGAGVKTVYLLAASSREAHEVEFAVTTGSGGVEPCRIEVPSWTAPGPVYPVGMYAPYLRGLSADDATSAGYLHALPVRASSAEDMVSVTLPKDVSVKVVAMTVEEER